MVQFKFPSQRGWLKADFVLDQLSAVRPGTDSYPFNAALGAIK